MKIRLKKLRSDEGLSQREMAERLGIKQRTYASWERMEATMSIDQALEVANILGCSIDDLIEWDSVEVPERKPVTRAEYQMVMDYRTMEDEERYAISALIRSLASRSNR